MTVLPQPFLRFITARDHRLMRRVHCWPAPKWIQVWMLIATRLGDGWLWYTLGALILVFGGAEKYAAVSAAGIAAAVGTVVFMGLKRLTGRKRPCALEPHCWSQLLPPDQFSFPSGHTITAFAVAVSVSLFYPALTPVLLFFAASIGASRILLGMHFLSDVFAGAAMGSLLGYATYLIYS